MTYVPDPRDYQQLGVGDPNGGVNCTAWGAAFRLDAHTLGGTRTTGRMVRLRSDEPQPDPDSPGLNLGQVDEAVRDITAGAVNFDTRVQSRSLSRPDVKWRITDGRFAGLSVLRGVFVDRGFLEGFRGAHDVTLFVRDTEPDVPVLFDPLVPRLTRVSWDVAFDAAEACPGTGGRIYAQFTRDRTPDYRLVIPVPHGERRNFYRFLLDDRGRIADKETRQTAGMDVRCSTPSYHASRTPEAKGQYLVQALEGGRKGWWFSARFSEEIVP